MAIIAQPILFSWKEIEAIFNALIMDLSKYLPDFGITMAVDGKAIESAARGKNNKETGDCRRESDADWGVKQYTVNTNDGHIERKVKRWFGFKVHTIIDAKYELPLAFEVTKASVSEYPQAHKMIKSLKEDHPNLLERCNYFIADRGYDDGKLHKRLWDHHEIKPVIGIRNLWKKPESIDATRSLTHQDYVTYDFEGQVYCYNIYGQKFKMAYGGFEKNRNTLKYRCPAKHYGCTCVGEKECRIKSQIRIPINEDRRIFGPLARDSYKWNDIYKKRTAIERVYSRLDTTFGFENHTIRGIKKMKLRVSMAYLAMSAMALGRIKNNQTEYMRSFLKAAA